MKKEKKATFVKKVLDVVLKNEVVTVSSPILYQEKIPSKLEKMINEISDDELDGAYVIFKYTHYGEDVEKILQLVTHHRDYFNSFDGVPQVCELLDDWEELEEEGWVLNFNANW